MKRLTEALKCCKLMQIGQLVRVAYSHNNANWDDLYTTRHVEHFQLWYAELVALLNLWLKAQNYKVEISVLMEGVTDQSVPELRATAVADVSVTGAAAPWRNEFFKLRCRFALKVWEKFHHMKYIENHWNTWNKDENKMRISDSTVSNVNADFLNKGSSLRALLAVVQGQTALEVLGNSLPNLDAFAPHANSENRFPKYCSGIGSMLHDASWQRWELLISSRRKDMKGSRWSGTRSSNFNAPLGGTSNTVIQCIIPVRLTSSVNVSCAFARWMIVRHCTYSRIAV